MGLDLQAINSTLSLLGLTHTYYGLLLAQQAGCHSHLNFVIRAHPQSLMCKSTPNSYAYSTI